MIILYFVMQSPKITEMDTVNNYVLYLATVSIKHKATDLIKAGLLFPWQQVPNDM